MSGFSSRRVIGCVAVEAQGVPQPGRLAVRHLNQAEIGAVSPFAHEFGIDAENSGKPTRHARRPRVVQGFPAG